MFSKKHMHTPHAKNDKTTHAKTSYAHHANTSHVTHDKTTHAHNYMFVSHMLIMFLNMKEFIDALIVVGMGI